MDNDKAKRRAALAKFDEISDKHKGIDLLETIWYYGEEK